MAEKWSLESDWIASCSCDPGYPCLFYADPTQGHCDSMDGYHVRKGKYGKVFLDGLNVVMLGKSPGNVWKGNSIGALYLDQQANPEQRKALEAIFGGKAGGPLSMLAGLISDNKGLKYAEINIDPKQISVSVPGVLEYQLKPTEGGDKTKPIIIENHPLSPVMDAMTMCIGTKSHYNDYGIRFDNTGKDGNYTLFHLKGP